MSDRSCSTATTDGAACCCRITFCKTGNERSTTSEGRTALSSSTQKALFKTVEQGKVQSQCAHILILFDASLRGEAKFESHKKVEMGSEEKDSEPVLKEPGSPEKEKESPVEAPQGQTPETSDPLNTYKWHTGSKGTLDEVKEGEEAPASSTSTIDRIQKASTNKWNKMQNWRKALSEDPGDKNPSSGKSGEAAKPEKSTGGNRKNPFRRALSEPPGSLFAARAPSSSAASTTAAASSSAAAEASGSSTDPAQKGGGGMLFKKYLRTVSQKLKRPKVQSRSSTPALQRGNAVIRFRTFGLKVEVIVNLPLLKSD